jgi:hypothetical protein
VRLGHEESYRSDLAGRSSRRRNHAGPLHEILERADRNDDASAQAQ